MAPPELDGVNELLAPEDGIVNPRRLQIIKVDLVKRCVLKRLAGSSIRGCRCLPSDAWPKGRRGLCA